MNFDTHLMTLRAEQALQESRLTRARHRHALQEAVRQEDAADTLPAQSAIRAWIARIGHSLQVALSPAHRKPGTI